VRSDAIWLRAPLLVHLTSDGRWTLDFNHPDLNRIDVYVLSAGHVTKHVVLGSLQP